MNAPQIRKRTSRAVWARSCGALLCLAVSIGGCAVIRPLVPTPAEQAFQRMAQEPANLSPLLDLVRHYIEQRDYLRARQYLTLCEHHTSARMAAAEIFRLNVSISVRSQNYGEAIDRCEQYLRENNDLPVRVLLATLLEVTGNRPAAERQRQLVLVHFPGATEQVVELARFFERAHNPDAAKRARRAYQQYLRQQPGGPHAEQARAALRTLDFDARPH